MNPFAPEVKAIPYPFYAAARAAEPVQWSPEIRAWLVTSYEHVLAVLTDPVTYSSCNSDSGGSNLETPEFPSLINSDGLQHRRLRSLVAKAFAPRILDSRWEPRIRQIADNLLDRVESKGTFDVVADLAELPARVIAEIIGVESGRFEDFKRWSDEIVSSAGRLEDSPPELGPPPPEPASSGLFTYLASTVIDRRKDPRDDLVTRLVEADFDGAHLSDQEIVSFLVLLIVSGNDAITDLIVAALRGLVSGPELLDQIRGRPDLVSKLVEEALRWDAPFQCFFRQATISTELAGKKVKEGDAILVVYGAANRDPAHFPNPDDFELGRAPHDHLAFGRGPHHCLGASLARLQAVVALEAIVERFASLREVMGFVPIWRDTPFFRGMVEYPLNFTTRPSEST
jgi:cytochrome P450